MNEYKYMNEEGTAVKRYPGAYLVEGGAGWPEYLKYVAAGGQTDPMYTREQVTANKLLEIDNKVTVSRRSSLFLHHTDGHSYHPDEDTISKLLVALPYVPVDWTITFKTADLAEDGINNVEVLMDVTEFVQFALGFQQRQSGYWYEGERIKKALKAMYLDNNVADEQLQAFDVETEWNL